MKYRKRVLWLILIMIVSISIVSLFTFSNFYRITLEEIKGDLKRAVGAAKKIIGDNTLLAADDLRKVGIAYLAARGHLS